MLLPIGIIHVVIQHFSAVELRHASGATSNFIQLGPQRFNDFAINFANTWNEVRTVSGIALVLMAIDMKVAYQSFDVHIWWYLQVIVLLYSVVEMDEILAGDVIADDCS
jgi:hypothetical protein